MRKIEQSTMHRTAERPALLLSEADHGRLTGLAVAALERFPEAAQRLLAEAERAEIVADGALPEDAIAMYSHVEFHDESHGTIHRVQLVYPGEADIAAGRISVLTLIGAALIGLSAGQSIAWPTREGRERRLTVLRVSREAFAA
jgi:regulator of nucleoside diphosphate kinase